MTILEPAPPIASAETDWLRLKYCSLAEETRELLQLRASRHKSEICGFIVGDNTILPVPNTSGTPQVSFTMDRSSILEAAHKHGPNITGIFHSHPSGRPHLTQSDENGMKVLYRAGCPWRYFIVTADDVIEYRWVG